MNCKVCNRPRVSMKVTHIRGQWSAVEVVCRKCQRWVKRILQRGCYAGNQV